MPTAIAKVNANSLAEFKAQAQKAAGNILTEWVGEEKAHEAAGRIVTAFRQSVGGAKSPDDFYACTPTSVACCIATAALVNVMPSTGRNALAYLIPRRPRKNSPPQLTYNLSHRGLNVLAKRSGQFMVPIPVSSRDVLDTSGDNVSILSRDIDNPPEDLDDLRGILVLVKSATNGVVLDRCWMPVSEIVKRRDTSDAYVYATKNEWAASSDPWHAWPIEQAMKTAMHYTVSRGICIIDDAATVRALSMDEQAPEIRPSTRSTSDVTTALLGRSDEGDGDSRGTGDDGADESGNTDSGPSDDDEFQHEYDAEPAWLSDYRAAVQRATTKQQVQDVVAEYEKHSAGDADHQRSLMEIAMAKYKDFEGEHAGRKRQQKPLIT